MAAENFLAAEDAYFTLRGQFDTGRITPQQFEAKLREHMVQDASGRYWMLGADSGRWYVYDGLNWVPGNPLAASASRTGIEPRYTPLAPGSKSPGHRSFPLVAILVAAAVLMLAVAGFLVFRNRGSLFVAQQPPQATPILPPTRANILDAGTSEPDVLNTTTPVPTPSSPAPNTPTRKATAPLAIVIPTVTPLALSTPPAQLPLPSAPAAGRRRAGNGPDAHARYMPVSQFSLDGSLNEWNGDGVPLNFPHLGTDNWQGPRDLSGTAWLGWNEQFLLVAVNVVDDTHVQTQRSWEMFRGDSVELWVDADLEGDFDVPAADGDDYQFGFSPGDFAGLVPEGVLYIPYRDALVNQQLLVAAKPTLTGYTLEAAVPWALLRAQPGKGRVFGYAVDLSDNDVPATAQQQTQVTQDPKFEFQKPETFGNLILE